MLVNIIFFVNFRLALQIHNYHIHHNESDHVDNVLTNVIYSCSYCSRPVSRRQNGLVSHLNKHHVVPLISEKSNNVYACSICSFSGSRQKADIHAMSHRMKSETTMCLLCSKEVSESHIEIHHKIHHRGKKKTATRIHRCISRNSNFTSLGILSRIENMQPLVYIEACKQG